MSRTLTISDELYARLEAEANRRGLRSIEELLELWNVSTDERSRVVSQINALRARLFSTYGEMPDSTTLIRKDRER